MGWGANRAAPMDIPIRVQPRASRNAVDVSDDGTIRVRVTSPPDRGRANDAVVELIAQRLGVPKSAVTISRGHRSRDKLIGVQGLDSDEVARRLRREG